MHEVLALDGKVRAWIDIDADHKLHYENQLTGKRWTQDIDLKAYHLRDFAISHDGCVVVIRTGYGHEEIGYVSDCEENLYAYNEAGECIYNFCPSGIYLSAIEAFQAQHVADILTAGDPEGEMREHEEAYTHQGAIGVRGARVTYCSTEVARLGNIFVKQLEEGGESNEDEILAQCRSGSERKTLKLLFPLLREIVKHT